MNYTELKDLCEQRKIFIKDIQTGIKMSQPGLRDALNKETLPIRKLVPLCRLLQITPNEFVGWNKDKPASITTTQVGVMNNQNVGTVGIELLHSQLEEKYIKGAVALKTFQTYKSKFRYFVVWLE